jgi:hypothetical protein
MTADLIELYLIRTIADVPKRRCDNLSRKADVMALRILLVVAVLAGFILVAIAVRQDALAKMPIGSIYMFVTGLGMIITALVVSIILVIMSE